MEMLFRYFLNFFFIFLFYLKNNFFFFFFFFLPVVVEVVISERLHVAESQRVLGNRGEEDEDICRQFDYVEYIYGCP